MSSTASRRSGIECSLGTVPSHCCSDDGSNPALTGTWNRHLEQISELQRPLEIPVQEINLSGAANPKHIAFHLIEELTGSSV